MKSFALFLVLMLQGIEGTVREDQQSNDLRVMSFNIRYGTAADGDNSWEHRRDLVVDVIRDFTPDVLGLQEALRFQLDEVGRSVKGYTEIGVGRDDGRTQGEYAAILVRADRFTVLESGTYWFSDTPEEPGSMSWGNRIPRICTWALLQDRKRGGIVSVFNTHWDHESQPSREKSADLLLESIGHFTDVGEPVIVMGDFNAGEQNPAFQRLVTDASIPLRDAFRSLHPTTKNVGTFNGFAGTTSGNKIDAILISGELSARQAGIVRTQKDGRYPSDHFPVTAVLRKK